MEVAAVHSQLAGGSRPIAVVSADGIENRLPFELPHACCQRWAVDGALMRGAVGLRYAHLRGVRRPDVEV
jgi:hypothetical protein